MTVSINTLHNMFDVLPDAAIVIDSGGSIVLANPATTPLLGYGENELLGQPLAILIPERFRPRHGEHVARFQRESQPALMGTRPVLKALHRSGEEVPVSISLANINLDGQRYTVAIVRDAALFHEHLGDAIAQAECDPLTGVGNRLFISQRIQHALAQGLPFGLLFLDLQRFKPFNDRYGHQAGDELLCVVAERLRGHVREKDTAARLGGDEFVVLLQGIDKPALLEARANAMADHLSKPFSVTGITADVGVVFGGALYPHHGTSESELLKAADKNMQYAKHHNKRYWIDIDAGDK